MKKVGLFLAVLFISLVFASLLVYAQESTDVPADVPTDAEGIKDVGTTVGTTIDTTLEKNIRVPESLQIPARIIFGVQGEISLQIFIIMIGIWTILFLIISGILEITPFFGGIKSYIGGFVIACLIGVAGTIRSLAIFFFNIGDTFSFLEWGIWNVLAKLVILGFLLYGASIVLKMLKRKVIQDKAEMTGTKAGAALSMLEHLQAFNAGYNR